MYVSLNSYVFGIHFFLFINNSLYFAELNFECFNVLYNMGNLDCAMLSLIFNKYNKIII